MPSTTSPRSALALASWRKSKLSRHNSTAQESKSFRDGEPASAMLHGNARKERPSGNNHEQRRQPQQPTPASHNTSQSSKHTQQSHHKQRSQQHQSHHPFSVSRKRRVGAHVDQRPTRRQRFDEARTPRPPLKDEAHIRSTMHVPKSEEYPDSPPGVFKNPKVTICNAVSGLAELRAETTEIANAVFLCTLHYKSAARNDAVGAEGITKVRYLSIQHLLLLIVYRHPPNRQPTYIYYAHSTSKGYSRKS